MIKLRKKWTIVLIVLFAAIFIASGIYLSLYFIEGHKERIYLEDLNQKYQSTMTVSAEEKEKIANLQNFKSQNSDLIGWIKIDGTVINYPVMQTISDPVYYLTHNFDKQPSASGTPFLDAHCNMQTSKNLILHAHNMKNGTMFASLLKYRSKDFYKTHKFIDMQTLTGAFRYEVFACFHIQAKDSNVKFVYNNMDYGNVPECLAFIKKSALYDTEIVPQMTDKFITLSTCSYNRDNERFVVIAKQI